ncbi:hypothetical protein DEO45_07115 [Rhodanobacter denitrificans]|uniref:Uncharacterized protein n=1 Tax=Rhodanobacter denitrificans TaxID=666685 RepID=A0A368KF93_9GAMM|nr:hypothetical protein [Rhodanobacter denitrificans]RCS30580.1 hypothetical protein DEO45_07115 [Rhodanobacter denitrificans]
MSIEDHRWTNNYLTITGGVIHALRVRAYYKEVIQPALTTLDAQIGTWESSNEDGALFAADDARQLKRATIEAFCLALQSIWERQLRGYLQTCDPFGQSDVDLQRATWDVLQDAFFRLRVIRMDAFDSFPVLDLLQLVGNACRHGDGPAARTLFERSPEFWPIWEKLVEASWAMPDGREPLVGPAPFGMVEFPAVFLQQATEAIAWFWEDVEYIYLASIARPTPEVPRLMEEMQAERRKRKQI